VGLDVKAAVNSNEEIVLARDVLFESVCNRIDTAVVLCERDEASLPLNFRIVSVNDALLSTAGVADRSAVVGKDIGEAFPGMQAMEILDALRRVCDSGQAELLPPVSYEDDEYRCGLYRLHERLVLVVFNDARVGAQAPGTMRERPDARRVAVIALDKTGGESRSERELDSRIRELTGLYHIFRMAQMQRSAAAYAQQVAVITARTVDKTLRAHASVVIDSRELSAGSGGAAGQKLVAPIFDGETHRGRIQITLPAPIPPRPQDQRFIDGAAQALGIWLRGDQARREVEMFRRIVANTREGMALIAPDCCFRVVNPAYADQFGLTPQAIQGRHVSRVLSPDAIADALGRLRRCFAGEEIRFQEWRDTPKGRRLLALTLSPFLEDDEVRGAIVSLHDITDLHDAQAGLRRAAKVFSAAREAIFTTDLDGLISDVNPAFCETTGYSREQALGRHASLVASGQHDESFFNETFERVALEGQWRGEIWNRRPDGEIYPCKMTISTVYEDEEPRGTQLHRRFLGHHADPAARARVAPHRQLRLPHGHSEPAPPA